MNFLFNKSLLRLMNLNFYEINFILKFSAKLKYNKFINNELVYLKDKNIVLIFEKDSTRTRCAFEVSAFDQGAKISYLGKNGNQIGYKESIKDSSLVLSRFYDGIQYRGYKQKNMEILSKYSHVPVWNGLSDDFHPTQMFADLLTIKEYLPNKSFNEIKLVYIGHACNNISNSLLELSALIGINLFLVAPKIYWPNKFFLMKCEFLSKKKGGVIHVTDDVKYGVKNADFIYTDVWLSMGEDVEKINERIFFLKKYQVNMNLLKKIGNINVKFMHCLPAFHDNSTFLGNKFFNKHNFLNGVEVSDEVFNSKYSIVFIQSENRLHTIKSIMILTLVKCLNKC